jgi:putative glutamine amidotransferase
MTESRPAIAICTALETARWGTWHRRAALLPYEYLLEIQRAGGLALMIPPDDQLIEAPDELLDRVDGLVLAGGVDVDPASYGAERHPATNGMVPERDRVELALTRRAVERDIPVLGICRGMQLLNVALGGTLNQHVPDAVGHEEHRRNVGTFEGNGHAVRLTPGSRAARATGEERHDTLSHHHQAVAELGDGLTVTGYSEIDDLPEAIEAPEQRFVLGVQWHPEADERSRVIRTLVSEAIAYRDARTSATR